MLPQLVVLDRDDTINVDHGYVHRWDDFEFLPRAVDAMRRLTARGIRIAIATNQSGIARGKYTADDFHRLMNQVGAALQAEGVTIDRVYFCPHLADGIVPDFSIACDCRKPEPGLLERALRDFAVRPADAVMIGDKPSDVQAAHAAGMRSYWITANVPAGAYRFPDGIHTTCAASLWDAVDDLLRGTACIAM